VEIRSKIEFYRLMEADCLGNTLRNWRRPGDAWDSGASLVGFREMGRAGGGVHSVVPRNRIHATFTEWVLAGRRFIMDEAAPDEDAQLQGEICRTVHGLQGLLGIRTKRRMRQAMGEGLLHPCSGVVVKALLDQFLDPSSRDDIDALFDLYPDATIEFASYPYYLGKLPARNTIIWEVRNY
jgi:hypothetical protein